MEQTNLHDYFFHEQLIDNSISAAHKGNRDKNGFDGAEAYSSCPIFNPEKKPVLPQTGTFKQH